MPLSSEELSQRWQTPEGRKRLADVLRALRRGEKNWERYLAGFTGVEEVPNGKDLRQTPLKRVRLIEADLSVANLNGADLYNANLRGAKLWSANLSEAYLRDANLNGAKLWIANLSGARFWSANLSGADLGNANLCRVGLSDASLRGASLTFANLSGARLIRANLSGANLEGANLIRANLYNADLTNANCKDAKFGNTELRAICFSPEHPVSYDFSETIVCPRRDKWLNWAILRKIGSFPLFGVSWVAFVMSLAVANFLGMVNTKLSEALAKLTEFLVAKQVLVPDEKIFLHPIPIPYRMELILVSSVCLVIGSTLYRFACPDAVQEFSETQWVSEHKQPRLIYYREKWRRRWLQSSTLVFSVIGAALALFLIIERLVMVAGYLWKF